MNYLKQIPKYLSADEIIDYNRIIIEKIRVKKADKHEVMSFAKINEVLQSCEKYGGDIYDKAVCLLKCLIKKHPFASANRRTAFLATKMFLVRNSYNLNVKDDPIQAKFLKKIREGSISDEEIKMWLRYGITKRSKQLKIIISKDKDLEEQIEQHRKLLEAIGRL